MSLIHFLKQYILKYGGLLFVTGSLTKSAALPESQSS